MRTPSLWKRRLTAGLAALVAVTFLPAGPALAAEPEFRSQQVEGIETVPGAPAEPKPVDVPKVEQYTPAAPVWPAAGTATVDLPPTASVPKAAADSSRDASSIRREAQAGTLPVWVSSARSGADAGRVRVEMLDRAAALHTGHELAVRVVPEEGVTAGPITVRIDYSSFATAYGADWAGRLRLVRLPECALFGTADTECIAEPLAVTRAGSSVSAKIADGQGAIVALSSGAAGGGGDFAATSLSPSAGWSAGGSSGGFSWSYDLQRPPALGGPMPNISFGYSSQSVDGRMVSTNNQASWIGEGFGYEPGFIERRYVSCADDMSGGNNSSHKTWDQCWKNDNATMSLNGGAGELIWNAGEKRWHSRAENGAHIERKTGAVNGDHGGDDDRGEYWVVTTTDGTRYYFGLNRLQGWTDGKPETQSVLSAPVYGNHSSEPCRQDTFAASSCTQAYRWNLDYVVDPHGNTMSFWYGKDTNKYGRNGSTTDLAGYDRDGHLKRIDYGTHQRALVGGVRTDTVFTANKAPAQVDFTPLDRCVTNCAVKANWQDVPWDQECTTSPCNNQSPTFWSTKRLSAVITKVWNAAAADYRQVEKWTLTHSFPDPGDGTPGSLWLARLSHQGLAATPIASVPDVVFTPVAMDNRVDTSLRNGLRPMRRMRMDTIVTEAGATIDVNYLGADCAAGSTPSPHANEKRCYPVRWAPEDLGEAPGTEITDWFHKYVVDNVRENDSTARAAGSPLATITRYSYAGKPAWRYPDDDGLTKANRRTWNQWRGYETVRTVIGEPGEQGVSEVRYFRGMHGDRLNVSGGTREARVTDSKGVASIDDLDEFAGLQRETTTYDSTGAAISGTLDTPWRGEPTASRSIGGQTVQARFTSIAETRTWAALDGGRPDRWTRTQHEFDAFGMTVRTTEFGDAAVDGDEKCVLTDYSRNSNTGVWLMSYPSRVRTFALTCAEATKSGRATTAADVLADVRTSFDDQAWGAAPTQGETTRIEELKDWAGDAPVMITTKRMAYDDYGRIEDMWDATGGHIGTAYTPTADGPVTKVVTTNAAGWPDTTETDPAFGVATRIVDINNRVTVKSYDALGRLAKAWLPGRATTATPTYEHVYLISNTSPSSVETKTLNPAGDQVSTIELYDALLRKRQTQSPSATGTGRVLTDTFYDTAGRDWRTWGPYVESTRGVEPTVWIPEDGSTNIDIWTRKIYDGASRVTEDIQFTKLTEKWRVSTRYTGDRTTTIPPLGGTASASVTDATGRIVERRQYKNRDLTGGYDSTAYTFDHKGQMTGVRDRAEIEWTFGYDVRGRQNTVTDPDKGTSRTIYDDYNRVTASQDGLGRWLTYAYDDALGRRTAVYEGQTATAAQLLASWKYDGVLGTGGTSVSRGMTTSSTRYVGGLSGRAYTTATTGLDTAGRVSKTTITVPAAEIGVGGTYEYQYTYRADGSPATTRVPAAGGSNGLAAETLTVGYQGTGLPTTLSTNLGSSYVAATGYTEFGEVGLVTLRNNSGRVAQIGKYYDKATRRLNRIWTTREVNPASISDSYFDYDAAGNIISITESSATAGAEKQCFGYDYLRRLTEAWTPANPDCAAAPTTTGLGGPAPYWTSWTFDAAGNRTEQVEHRTTAGARTTTYTYPDATADQPHTLSGTTIADTSGTRTAVYGYDGLGNTLTRPAPAGGTQTLDWDVEGRLSKSTDSTGVTTYLYDADGKRLIKADPSGERTLYLPGQELKANSNGAVVDCSRYYSHGGTTIAVRSRAGVSWLGGDHQGTSGVAIDAASQAFSVRRQDPYGNPRGPATGTSWPTGMNKGFVGGAKDGNGLTHLGAREYDPLTGRFVSVDPLVDFTDPQQIHGYTYSNSTPVTMSDPSGLAPLTGEGPNDRYDGPKAGPKGGKPKRDNPYNSDQEERQSTGNDAEAERIRQYRLKQINEGYLGIRARIRAEVDEMIEKGNRAAAGRSSAWVKLFAELSEEWTEEMVTNQLIENALDKIDESRYDGHVKTGDGEFLAFDDDEFQIAFQLAFTGHMVESRDESIRVVGNADDYVFDAYVDDVRSEFKSVSKDNSRPVKNHYSKANGQHVERLYLWTSENVSVGAVKNGQRGFVLQPGQTVRLKEVQVLGNVTAPLQPISTDLNCEGWDWWTGC